MSKLGLKTIDLYIIKKFLGTYFYAIAIIISIAVVFDLSEKIEDFLEKEAPLRAIIFDYYLNFIPYFANLFSSLFTFIAVIFFTSKMAYNTEIIAILSTGVSFKRILFPYFLSASVIALLSYFLMSFIIPPANQTRLEFRYKYIKNPYRNKNKDIHRQIEPGTFIYMKSYNTKRSTGHKFSIEKFDDQVLKSKLISNYIKWDSTKNLWTIKKYYIRNYISEGNEEIIKGESIDTVLNMLPEDFSRNEHYVETMNSPQLNKYIKNQKMQGASNITSFLIEKYRRIAFPFSTFILTLIGVSLSSRKVRGGMGMHIGAGLLLSFSYILFMRFATLFAISGSLHPLFAVWLPNIIYSIIALFIYRLAPR
ncbi:MAG: LptF/LptG family permease [Bacteroidales bacterium]|jgi:lipopolysaccharide export system permease protein|nr:LptF/LptG family permease [Bacteroidales bacterium]